MKIEQSFGYLLNLSARLLKRRLDTLLKEYGITTTQWGVLKLLSEENHLSQATIADRAYGDRATFGAVIDNLIKKGFVEKKLSKTDRRSYVVSILPQAIHIVNEVSSMAENLNYLALESLSEEQKAMFMTFLKVVIANMEEEKDDLEI